MISFTITTPEGKQKISAPNNWNEITYDQLCKRTLWDGTDIIKLFSILTGISFEKANELTDPNIDETLYEICGFIFQNEPDWPKLKPPKQILWNNKLFKIPHDLRNETLAQSMMMGQVLRSEDTVMEAIPKAVAIYMHTIIEDTRPDNQKMLDMALKLKNRSAMEVYSTGNFFLSRLRKFNHNFLRLLLLRDQTRLKKLREQKNSMNSKT